jgi:hypothetical protein
MADLFSFLSRTPDIASLAEACDVDSLIRLLGHHSFTVQWRAADALGSLGERATLPLLAALSSRNDAVRIGAVEALGAIRDSRSVGPLSYLLEHEKVAEVRWVAALALGMTGDPHAVPPLVHALRDPEKYVRYGAAKALESLGWTPSNPEEQACFSIALQDWISLEDLGDLAVDPLIGMTGDDDVDTRYHVVNVLGRIAGSPRARTACEKALRDQSPLVRWEAVLSAQRCGVPITRIPWGLSKRPHTGKNPWAAAVLNFFFIGLGYNYLGYWWGFLVFMSYMSLIVLTQLKLGPFTPYLIAYPVTALFAVQTFYLAKRMPDI